MDEPLLSSLVLYDDKQMSCYSNLLVDVLSTTLCASNMLKIRILKEKTQFLKCMKIMKIVNLICLFVILWT